jgi:hypothetical protein
MSSIEKYLKIISGEKLWISRKDIFHFCENHNWKMLERWLDITIENIQESNRYWVAVKYCYWYNGKLYIGNKEYENETKFCPFCWYSVL